MIKSVIAAPFIPISSIFSSHRGAQGIIYGDMIDFRGEEEIVIDMGAKMVDDFNDFDRLYIYHGNDWQGSLNLYGGLENFPYALNFKNISNFKGEVFSLSHDMPNYYDLFNRKMNLTKEANKPISEHFKAVNFDNLISMQNRAKTIKHPHLTNKITIGDSHGISMYRPGWTVNSIPYKTLYGALNDGLLNYVIEPYKNSSIKVEEIELYFGNIDIRHHLCRQPDPINSSIDLALKYVKESFSLKQNISSIKNITICELLPIEDESRVIPKSGMYDGKGFSGSWKERDLIRKIFNDTCEQECQNLGIYFKRWTSHLLNEKGQLDFKHMEYKRSVHLSRMSYPHWNGQKWNDLYLKKVKKVNNLEDFLNE